MENQEFKNASVGITCGQICQQGKTLANCLENIDELELAKSIKRGFRLRYWYLPKQPNGLPLEWKFSSMGGGWRPTGLPEEYYEICTASDTEALFVSDIDPTQEYRMIRPVEFNR